MYNINDDNSINIRGSSSSRSNNHTNYISNNDIGYDSDKMEYLMFAAYDNFLERDNPLWQDPL